MNEKALYYVEMLLKAADVVNRRCFNCYACLGDALCYCCRFNTAIGQSCTIAGQKTAKLFRAIKDRLIGVGLGLELGFAVNNLTSYCAVLLGRCRC